MPLIENGVGSVWGLPVIREGERRVSALAVSEKLERPGKDTDGPEARRLRELEDLGVGPLGRYCGGEPIRPVRLSAGDFFSSGKEPAAGEPVLKDLSKGTAGGFWTRLECDETRWTAAGDTAAIFHDHLEFLRTWGFSGGVIIEERRDLAELLGGYLLFLRNEAPGAKIILVLSKDFFDRADYTGPGLQNVKPFGDPGAGEIPLNFVNGGEPVLSASFCGLGVVFYEDLPPDLKILTSRCDILVNVVRSGISSRAGESVIRDSKVRIALTITVVRHNPAKKIAKTGDTQKSPLAGYLYRSLVPAQPGPPAPFSAAPSRPRSGKNRSGCSTAPPVIGKAGLSRTPFSGGREEAAALDGEVLLPLWEAGRIEAAGGGLFAVTAKFSGLRALDVKDEQAWFYRNPPEGTAGNTAESPPPVRPGAAFSELNEQQLGFFLRWRHKCRRGREPDWNTAHAPALDPNGYGETYIRLYARELALCMGREGPMRHFLALRDLFHACRAGFPETGALLCRWLLDFAVIYGIASQALPLLMDELEHETGETWTELLWKTRSETASILTDLSLHRFFIEEDRPLEQLLDAERDPAWVCVKALIPEKLLRRKESALDAGEDWAPHYRRALGAIDKQLRHDWNRSFFEFFYPPRPQSAVLKAFDTLPHVGESSYRVYWTGFTSHRPLLDILSGLFLDPRTNPLHGLEAHLHPLTLEGELLEELRRESDAVRDILKTETGGAPQDPGEGPRRIRGSPSAKQRPALPSETAHRDREARTRPPENSYVAPDRADLEEFIAVLGTQERSALRNIAQGDGAAVTDMTVDAINGAFNKRFGDLLVEISGEGPSISPEYRSILPSWE
jgi:hypothetical protein